MIYARGALNGTDAPVHWQISSRPGPRQVQARASSRATAAVRALRPCRPSFAYAF